jgi:glycosyltransferase involved in cell wall biosynthesis
MKCLNEERAVKRVLSDFHDEQWVDRIIVIDGGSTDYTIQELKQFSKVEVFIHPWLDWYHDSEVCQSNIALSYVPEGKILFILDFDEKMSPELKQFLSEVDKRNEIPEDVDIGHIARKTFDLIRYEDSPHAIIGDDGWPIISHTIGQFPDFQCRLIKKSFRMKWVNSPHHVLIGFNKNVNIDPSTGVHILHYEKDDFRDRERIEKKWIRAQIRRRTLGLTADVFETNIKPELTAYATNDYWRD